MSYYRVDMRGEAQSQQMQNTLFYRDRDPFGGDPIARAQELNDALIAHYFPLVGGALQPVIHSTYLWTEFSTMPLADVGFGPAISQPVVTPIGKEGTAGDNALPPGNCAIFRYLLLPGSVLGGLYQPRTSYLSMGIISESHVDDAGKLTDEVLGSYNAAAHVFALDVGTVLGVGGWAPVRYGRNGFGIQGFAEVSDCVVRRVISYRKSRQPEG